MSSRLFAGPLAVFARTLVLDDARPVVPLPELLRDETLDRLLLQVYGPALMPDKLPVLVSQWFKYYAMQLMPPVLVASLVHGVSWPLQLDHLGFALHQRGILEGVKFGAPMVDALRSDAPFQRFAALLDNLQQVIDRLSGYGKVAPGVLWGNAGDYLETCLGQLAAVSDVPLDAGYGLLREKLRPDGTRNPLFNAITYIEGSQGQSVRQRRSCCLSYQVQWVGRCEHCPLHGADTPWE
ncbi:MAG TPA: siderophore-iron reductase FhuF [Pseudomonas sp.]|nr:siderophore-iron reductase FhuF [Pseudomonas sp.]